MLLSILSMPFLGSLCTSFVRWLGPLGYQLTVYIMIVDLLIFNLLSGESLTTNSWLNLVWFTWVDCGSLVYTFELSTSPLSLVIAYVVLVVSTLVHCYSLWYLAGDPHQSRFFGLISLFTGFMLVLVHAGNSAVIFLGWEGIGVVSFLLISFWFTRLNAVQSAIQAFLLNRVGDMFLMLALASLSSRFLSLDQTVICFVSSGGLFSVV